MQLTIGRTQEKAYHLRKIFQVFVDILSLSVYAQVCMVCYLLDLVLAIQPSTLLSVCYFNVTKDRRKIPKGKLSLLPITLSRWTPLGSSNMLQTLSPPGLLISCSISLEYYPCSFTRLISTPILDNHLVLSSSVNHILCPRPSLMALCVLLRLSPFTPRSTLFLSVPLWPESHLKAESFVPDTQ